MPPTTTAPDPSTSISAATSSAKVAIDKCAQVAIVGAPVAPAFQRQPAERGAGREHLRGLPRVAAQTMLEDDRQPRPAGIVDMQA